ncbi:hypothetical protein BaRGS_00030636 [Batillaria attramentaria]|uniref:Uncharacterized protein n=1 Tax=Batillaria attramentaria TaxID=370345 RepID=A0ABD0JSL7_9CAEN
MQERLSNYQGMPSGSVGKKHLVFWRQYNFKITLLLAGTTIQLSGDAQWLSWNDYLTIRGYPVAQLVKKNTLCSGANITLLPFSVAGTTIQLSGDTQWLSWNDYPTIRGCPVAQPVGKTEAQCVFWC